MKNHTSKYMFWKYSHLAPFWNELSEWKLQKQKHENIDLSDSILPYGPVDSCDTTKRSAWFCLLSGKIFQL